jgi:hypothetical protein
MERLTLDMYRLFMCKHLIHPLYIEDEVMNLEGFVSCFYENFFFFEKDFYEKL